MNGLCLKAEYATADLPHKLGYLHVCHIVINYEEYSSDGLWFLYTQMKEERWVCIMECPPTTCHDTNENKKTKPQASVVHFILVGHQPSPL